MGKRLHVTKRRERNLQIKKAVSGEGTIIAAFESILNVAHNSELEHNTLDMASESFDLLISKLSITPIQAIILAMIIDFNNGISIENMARFLNVRNIRMLTYMNEINDLLERRIIRMSNNNFDNNLKYEIQQEVLVAYMQNQNYEKPNIKNLSPEEFICAAMNILSKRREESISYEDLCSDMTELVENNQQYELCKWVNPYDINLQILFFICCTQYAFVGDLNITRFELSNVFDAAQQNRICHTLDANKNTLIENNLLEYYNNNGVIDNDGIGVSESVRCMLNKELNIDWDESDHNVRQGLIQYENIIAKEMFYNDSEKKSIDALCNMLQVDAFKEIQSRLADNGMRKGFACIFYGAPGTGKTETVLQLARLTGRDIMQINIASIKSKWVGGSERNIKNIFNQYQQYCAKCERTPILFFNEADAIINKRSENIEHSVDKMENAMQNILLEELEKQEGILIATTNLTNNMDKAFERRFLYKIEFKKPNTNTKALLWQSMIKDLSENDAQELAKEYDFSGGQIENIARKQVVRKILYNTPIMISEIEEDCKNELLSQSKEQSRPVGFTA